MRNEGCDEIAAGAVKGLCSAEASSVGFNKNRIEVVLADDQRELILKRGWLSSSHSHYGASRYEWDLGRIAVAEREHRSLNRQIEFLLDRAVREKPPNEPRPVRLSEGVVPERGLEPPRP